MIINIDAEFESLIPPMRPEEFKRLEQSILSEGVRDPLLTWKGGLLVDGHNRYRIIQKHDIREYPVKVLADLPDRNAVLLWIVLNQLSRRNLTKGQIDRLAGRVSVLRAKVSRANAAQTARDVKAGKTVAPDSRATDQPKEKKRTEREVAKEYKTSEGAVHAAAILAKAVDGEGAKGEKLDAATHAKAKELDAKVAKGELSVIKAAQELRPQTPPLVGQKRIRSKTYNARIDRIFTAVAGLSSSLVELDLENGPLEVTGDQQERYLADGQQFISQLQMLMRRFRPKAPAKLEDQTTVGGIQ